jgi:hypothetical protein
MPLGKYYLGKLVISFIWLQVTRSEKKKGKKEKRLLVFFLNLTCNLPFPFFVIILDSFQVVILFCS